MPLVVRPVEHADVAQCIEIRVASLGSLVIGRPPPYPGYVQEAETSAHRDLDKKSPHVRHLKVVDAENEAEVIAYGKWEVYPRGRPDLDKLGQPMDDADKQVDRYGMLREAAHEYFCSRNGVMGKHPHLLLALLVTDSQHRQRGAGSLLYNGGLSSQVQLVFLAIFRLLNKDGACMNTMDFKRSIRSSTIFRTMD